MVKARTPRMLIISIPELQISRLVMESLLQNIILQGKVFELISIQYFRAAHYWSSFLKDGEWYKYNDAFKGGIVIKEKKPSLLNIALLYYKCNSQPESDYKEPDIPMERCQLPVGPEVIIDK